MPVKQWGSLKLIPGVNVEKTPALNEAGVSQSQSIRYRDGMIEKLGGWDRYFASAMTDTARALHIWQDLTDVARLAVACDDGLYLITNGVKTDITPKILRTTPTAPFATVASDPTVTVTDPVFSASDVAQVNPVAVVFNIPAFPGGVVGPFFYGPWPVDTRATTTFTIEATIEATGTLAATGSPPTMTPTNGQNIVSMTAFGTASIPFVTVGGYFQFDTPETVGGVVLSGSYYVYERSGNTLRIRVGALCSGSTPVVMNSGRLDLTYYLSPLTSSVTLPAATTKVSADDWTLDNWGSFLVACAEDGPIFYWSPQESLPYASYVTNAPALNTGIFVAMPQQILVAYGSSIAMDQDPLLLRWCSAGDLNDWTASSEDQAGSFRIPTGSRIVGGVQGPQQGVIWTDLDVWAMPYIGPPLVFGFTKLATGCGLVGKHAVCKFGSSLFWMSQKQFYRMEGSGGVSPVPCTVWDAVFQNINTAMAHKVVAASNSQFNEVTWYYPSLNATENDSYVKVNVLTGEWDYGLLGRSAWIDQSLIGSPIGTDASTNYIYQHEESPNADGAALVSSFRTGWAALGNGMDYAFVDRLEPDFKWGTYSGDPTAGLSIIAYTCDYIGGPERVEGPFTFSSAVRFINTRIRARFISFKIESRDLGSFWRVGNIRYRYKPLGKR